MSLSAHLVETYERKPIIHPYNPPHPQRPLRPAYFVTSTPFTDRRNMNTDPFWYPVHGGGPGSGPSHVPSSATTASGFSRWSEEKIAALQVRLTKRLGPEYVTQRPGPGGGPKLSYIEGWKVINLANEVFGFNGWSSSIVSLTTDFIDVNEHGRVSVNVTAIVRITLADGCWHEDVGCGQGENIKSKGGALDKAKKEAVTDATKRALRTFGNVLGNCLYDREYTKEVVKMKVPPAKFQPSELERRAEFTEPGAPGPARPTSFPPHTTNVPRPPAPTRTPSSTSGMAPPDDAPTPLHLVQEMTEDAVFMDENLDAEFLSFEGQSFFDGIDQSVTMAVDKESHIIKTEGREAERAQPQSGPSKPSNPIYQHRLRPDMPPTARPDQFANGVAARQAALLSEPMNAAHTMGVETGPAEGGTNLRQSFGGTSETLDETPQKRPAGGFAYPDTTGRPAAPANTGQSARALAISNALAQSSRQQQAHQPIRSESPRIPNGGIDEVAAKATSNFAASAALLGLEGEKVEVVGDKFGGFSSARSMKRNKSEQERGSVSPTKSGMNDMISRSGPRRVLGELDTTTADWGGKRFRP